jgi:cytochrome o ubiquinol oxidase operon protein cyoD
MSTHYDPLEHPEVQQGSAGRYLAAFVASAALMGGAYYASTQKLPLVEFAATAAVLSLAALVSQLFLFFGLNASQAQIWKSISLFLAIPLFIVTIGLTVWAFSSLYARTMPMDGMLMSGQPTLLQ